MALKILPTPSLRERTSLRLGGTAVAEVSAASEADLDGLAAALERLGGTPVALGAGTNILARDGELPLVLVRAEAPKGVEPVQGKAEGERTVVRAGAGFGLPLLLAWLRDEGLAGLEPLAGIPGSVGGAVAMNAGSYGVEFGSCLRRIRIWTPRLGLSWLEPGEWEATYRKFRPIPGRQPLAEGELYLVWEVELSLDRGEPAAIGEAMRSIFARKKASQPVSAASAGCVFKNPEGESAGRLLERAGLRGRRLGGMAFSEVHANFMVNLGGGTSGEALELIRTARDRVRETTGHELALEVKVWP